jgi:hypothetical protein
MAEIEDTSLFINEDRSIPCTILNKAQTTALDITSWTLSWLVKRRESDVDASALVTKTTASGIAISGSFNPDPDVNTQVATISVADTDTVSLSPGLYYHELKRTDAGAETVLITGRIKFMRSLHIS